MELRQASPKDLDFILALEQHFRDAGFLGGDSRAMHEQRLAETDCRYYIAEVDARPAGYVILRAVTAFNRNIELKRIAIAEPGRGIGRKVLLEIQRKAFDEFGAHRLWLDVFDDNHRARHVYRSLGFVEEGTMRECVRYETQYRSLVLMSILEDEYRKR